MKYVKFETAEQAEEYRVRLQAHHDETHQAGPRIVDCVLPTWDGKFALTLQDEGYPDVGAGEVVDTVESEIIIEETFGSREQDICIT